MARQVRALPMVVHIAGEPDVASIHITRGSTTVVIGEQHCTRCGFVLRTATPAEDDQWFYLPGALLQQINEHVTIRRTVRFVAVRCRPTCRRRGSLRFARAASAV
jgi:hypothetical protein